MLFLKHVTASGDLDGNMWSYDPARQCVIVVYLDIGVDIPVATEFRPRIGSYSIRRIDSDGSCWEIAPSVFDKRTVWASHIADYPDMTIPRLTIQLSAAPPEVAAEMDQLFV